MSLVINNQKNEKFCLCIMLPIRGEILKHTIWSPWPWPQVCKSSKMPRPQLKDSTILWLVENGLRPWLILFHLGACQRPCKKFCRPFSFGNHLNFAETKRFFWAKTFFWRILRRCVLEYSCAWPWAFLFFTLRGYVLNLGFFCPWPKALCPWPHLC